MFRVLQKLKRIKVALRRMKRQGWNDAEAAAGKAKARLEEIQNAMHENPRDASLCTDEKEAQKQHKQAHKMVYSMLQQQAKLTWLKCGDENSKVFYQAIRARRRHNKVHAIHDMDGKWLNKKEQVEEAFIKFYKNLFTEAEQKKAVQDAIMRKGKLVTEVHERLLLAEFTKEDVKRVMFSIPNDKAPGIDGFNSYFFKHCWEVIGYEVCEAVLDFFRTGKLLKVINVTTLTLIYTKG